MSRVGWIGTGIMGRSMAMHLISAGHELSVYNRTKERASDLLEAGARWGDSPADVAREAEFVFTIVGYPADVESVYFGESGVFSAAAAGSVLVDMTTSEPTLAERIAATAVEKSMASLDAPVSGGDVGAREARLAIMVGGAQDAYERVLPLFELMGQNIKRMGPAGAGQHTKMCNQTLIAAGMIGVVESLLYARRAGLDLEEVIRVIGKGAAGSWSINNLGPRIAAGDMEPGFMIEHFVKDMGIALGEARRMNLSLPGLALAFQFYQAAIAQGLSRKGTQALSVVLDALNGRR